MDLTTLEKLEKAAPYNIFCNVIPASPETLQQPDAIAFKDLLCPSLGELKCSFQTNFIITVEWLIKQYEHHGLDTKPLTLLYGMKLKEKTEAYIEKSLPNVTHHFVEMKGCHHGKIGIYVYEDNSLRVVVSTANLYPEEWYYANQQLWISPLCRPLSTTASETSGESPTNFKSSLLHYLESYKLDVVQPWISYVKNADFSDVKVFLILSIPGQYVSPCPEYHTYTVGDLLTQHCHLPENEGSWWPIMAQMSSVGYYGKSPAEWLRSTFLRSVAGHDRSQMVYISSAPLKIIYPSLQNVRDGFLSVGGAFVLNYDEDVRDNQQWLKTYLYQWKADKLGRTRAMPHQKIYCRISPCLTKLGWFLLTSANLSRGAWGSKTSDKGVFVRNYEVGVLFFPKFFGEEFFEIGENGKFPFLCDLPLTEYGKRDQPWCT